MHVCAPSYAFLPAICQALKIRKRLFSAKSSPREPEKRQKPEWVPPQITKGISRMGAILSKNTLFFCRTMV